MITQLILALHRERCYSEAMKTSDQVVRRLGEELHRQYRAAEKALNGAKPTCDPNVDHTLRHDHGWEHCHRQKYFLQRAQTIIKRAACDNPQTLGEAEQALDSIVLLRRLIVNNDRFSRTVGDFPKSTIQVDMTEEICKIFQMPEIMVTGNTGDARRKARRDQTVRETLWPRTKAISGPQGQRGLL